MCSPNGPPTISDYCKIIKEFINGLKAECAVTYDSSMISKLTRLQSIIDSAVNYHNLEMELKDDIIKLYKSKSESKIDLKASGL